MAGTLVQKRRGVGGVELERDGRGWGQEGTKAPVVSGCLDSNLPQLEAMEGVHTASFTSFSPYSHLVPVNPFVPGYLQAVLIGVY